MNRDKEIISDLPVCECCQIHEDDVSSAKKTIPDDGSILALGELYKVFGEASRLRILYLLYNRELCVCDIASALESTVSAVSHQLKILRNAKLIKFRKEGKNCFYSLADSHITGILSMGMEHINE